MALLTETGIRESVLVASVSDNEPDVCPYPGHDSVRCPECRTDIPGVVPAGTPENPAARCPACDERITTVIIGE